MLLVASLGICVSSYPICCKPDKVYCNRQPIHNIKLYLSMENVVLCHPDKEETELDDIPGNRTAPTTEKEDSDRE